MASLLTIGKDPRSIIFGLVDDLDLYTLRFVCRAFRAELRQPMLLRNLLPLCHVLWCNWALNSVRPFVQLLRERNLIWLAWFKTTVSRTTWNQFVYNMCCVDKAYSNALQAFLPDLTDNVCVRQCLHRVVSGSSRSNQAELLALLATFLQVKASWHCRWLCRSYWVDCAIQFCYLYGFTQALDELCQRYGPPNRIYAALPHNAGGYSGVWSESLDAHYLVPTILVKVCLFGPSALLKVVVRRVNWLWVIMRVFIVVLLIARV